MNEQALSFNRADRIGVAKDPALHEKKDASNLALLLAADKSEEVRYQLAANPALVKLNNAEEVALRLHKQGSYRVRMGLADNPALAQLRNGASIGGTLANDYKSIVRGTLARNPALADLSNGSSLAKKLSNDSDWPARAGIAANRRLPKMGEVGSVVRNLFDAPFNGSKKFGQRVSVLKELAANPEVVNLPNAPQVIGELQSYPSISIEYRLMDNPAVPLAPTKDQDNSTLDQYDLGSLDLDEGLTQTRTLASIDRG